MNASNISADVTDVGDYLKLGACTAVMAQPILADALTTAPSIATQIGIGIFIIWSSIRRRPLFLGFFTRRREQHSTKQR